jgi:hypothetical protein
MRAVGRKVPRPGPPGGGGGKERGRETATTKWLRRRANLKSWEPNLVFETSYVVLFMLYNLTREKRRQPGNPGQFGKRINSALSTMKSDIYAQPVKAEPFGFRNAGSSIPNAVPQVSISHNSLVSGSIAKHDASKSIYMWQSFVLSNLSRLRYAPGS